MVKHGKMYDFYRQFGFMVEKSLTQNTLKFEICLWWYKITITFKVKWGPQKCYKNK